MPDRFRLPVAVVAAALLAASAGAGTLSIAAAANLTFALNALDTEFSKAHPDIAVTVTTGSSGTLVAQIRNGAPYEVFLSADTGFPKALVAAGMADARSLTPFAVGRLVLWSAKPGLVVTDVAQTVRSPAVHVLAIANTASAPYGRAARQALERLGLWDVALPKLVTGEDISQATQFVATGNADAGFVALSAVLSPKLKGTGSWTLVPAALYDPLVHEAVITARGAPNPASAQFLAFLQGDVARAVFRDLGYGIPDPAGPSP